MAPSCHHPLLLVVVLAGWLPSSAAEDAPGAGVGISAQLRWRDGHECALGSSMPLVLDIINSTDDTAAFSWIYPEILGLHLTARDADGTIHFHDDANERGFYDGHLTWVAARTVLSVTIYLGHEFTFTVPGREAISWELSMPCQTKSKGALLRASGTMELVLIDPDAQARAQRVAALIARFRQIANGGIGEWQERAEIVQELCAIDGPEAIRALRDQLVDMQPAAEFGVTIIRSLGERISYPQAMEVVHAALANPFADVVSEALEVFRRRQTLIDPASLHSLLASDNPGIQWAALTYLERILKLMPASTIEHLISLRVLEPTATIPMRDNDSPKLRALAESITRTIAGRLHELGANGARAPADGPKPATDAAGF
jgi:hypothetical protein